MLILILLTIFFSIFSTAILSYISMAVMMGPWIQSVIVIMCTLLFSLFARRLAYSTRLKSIALVTAGSSLGGILATGCGFAFPAIYFLDAPLFEQWLAAPAYFCFLLGMIALSAGSLGLLVAGFFERNLIVQEQLPFPVGEISYTLAATTENKKNTVQLLLGAGLTGIYNFFTRIYGTAQKMVIAPAFQLKTIKIPALGIPIQEFPLLLAIGFIAGTMVMIPLTVGIIARLVVMNPVQEYFFAYLSYNDFSFAFISGMVLYGALMSLLELPKFLKGVTKKLKKLTTIADNHHKRPRLVIVIEAVLIIALLTGMFLWFGFSWGLQWYVILFTVLCTYQLLIIGGELGLAPVGRFATFVMMPAMIIMNANPLQLIVISTFVEVCGGVGVDVLFGRKFAHLAQVEHKKVRLFQWIGLITSAATVGIIFWLLISKFGLGTAPLIAQRSQTRALNIQFKNFDFYAMVVGALFGSVLKDFKINPVMVLGGILMPLEWVLSLVMGGALSLVSKHPKEYHLFWSGVFATASIIMIVKAII